MHINQLFYQIMGIILSRIKTYTYQQCEKKLKQKKFDVIQLSEKIITK